MATRLYEDRGALANIITGSAGGAAIGLGAGLLTGLWQFTPDKTAPAFSWRLLAKSMNARAGLFGALAFGFTLGEGISSMALQRPHGSATLTGGSMGVGTVIALYTRSATTGVISSGLLAGLLFVAELSDWRVNQLPDEQFKQRYSYRPEIKEQIVNK